MIKSISNIVKGHVNELLNKNQEMSEKRMAICKACPLYKESNIGPMCNPNMYLDPKTGDFRYSEKIGFIKGCGCRLEAKTTLLKKDGGSCPAGKW